MCAKSCEACTCKRQEFWRETHTSLWLLIGRIVSLTREERSFALLIGRYLFFSLVKNIVRSFDWLELIRRSFSLRIHLSMYKIKEGTVSTPICAFFARKSEKI